MGMLLRRHRSYTGQKPPEALPDTAQDGVVASQEVGTTGPPFTGEPGSPGLVDRPPDEQSLLDPARPVAPRKPKKGL